MGNEDVCVWEYADKDVPFYLWVYVTECGGEFTLLDSDEEFAELGFHYCPKCRRRINVLRPKEGEK